MDWSNRTLKPLYDRMAFREAQPEQGKGRRRELLVDGKVVPGPELREVGLGMWDSTWQGKRTTDLTDALEPLRMRQVAIALVQGTLAIPGVDVSEVRRAVHEGGPAPRAQTRRGEQSRE